MTTYKKLILSQSQFERFQEDVLGIPNVIIRFQRQLLDVPDVYLRVETAIKKRLVDVEAIRATIPEMLVQINSCTERGEHPKLLIKLIRREKTGKLEIELVFYGGEKERHVEKLSYYEKHPSKWVTFGEIVLTIEETKKCVKFLNEIIRKAEGQKTLT